MTAIMAEERRIIKQELVENKKPKEVKYPIFGLKCVLITKLYFDYRWFVIVKVYQSKNIDSNITCFI